MTGSEDDGELSRPFLETSPSSEPLPGSTEDPDDDDRVRPYLITTGRTSPEDTAVQMQTVVVVASQGEVCPSPTDTAEHARIIELCRQPHSVAELAAGLRVPLGVARVLVADLLGTGLLATGPSAPQQATDVPFLERLIAGVAAL